MPAPEDWVSRNFSPTHSQILFMFEQLRGSNFTCGLDNLFISAKFARAALSEIDQKVMIHGVCRTDSRGLPECVLMTAETTDARAKQRRGEVKAAVLKDAEKMKDMVAFSVYDTKPVHFISTAAKSLKWIPIKRKVWDVNSGKMVEIKFLRTELQNDYNHKMNDVDISDQLRKVYCFNRWVRNRKWWWALFMWGLGVIVVNAYVA